MATGSTVEAAVEAVEAAKNLQDIVCVRCNCLIVRKGVADSATCERKLPSMMRRDERAASIEGTTESAPGEPEQKLVTKCWVLNDMFAFENVGFCRDVQVAGSTLKYLACADCEVGPIGWHDPAVPKEFYVAHDRIALRP